MRIEIKPKKSIINTKDLKAIESKFKAAGLIFNLDYCHTDSSVKTTTYTRRLMKIECSKLIKVGCTIVRKMYNSEKQNWHYKETSLKNETVTKTEQAERKPLKIPNILRGFSGNICVGFDVKFK